MKSRVLQILLGLITELLLCGVWLAVAPATASPSIVWSGPVDRLLVPVAPEFDANGDGSADFLFRYNSTRLYLTPLGNNAGMVDSTRPGGVRLLPLADNTWIGETLVSPYTWDNSENMLLDYVLPGSTEGDGDGGGGPWHGVQRGLMGLSFEIDGRTYYGWARLSDMGSTQAAVLNDWAYEMQPGMGIYAGVVPEPTTLALFACGIGTLGLATWRRRQRALRAG